MLTELQVQHILVLHKRFCWCLHDQDYIMVDIILKHGDYFDCLVMLFIFHFFFIVFSLLTVNMVHFSLMNIQMDHVNRNAGFCTIILPLLAYTYTHTYIYIYIYSVIQGFQFQYLYSPFGKGHPHVSKYHSTNIQINYAAT